jgi:hypothetical protein
MSIAIDLRQKNFNHPLTPCLKFFRQGLVEKKYSGEYLNQNKLYEPDTFLKFPRCIVGSQLLVSDPSLMKLRRTGTNLCQSVWDHGEHGPGNPLKRHPDILGQERNDGQ